MSESNTETRPYDKMESYFNTYTKNLRKHKYIHQIVQPRDDIDLDVPDMNKQFGLYAYGQTVSITLSSDWLNDVEDIKNEEKHLKDTIERDMSFMYDYDGGTSKIRVLELNGEKCKLKLIYAPEEPVFDFQS